MSRQASYGSYGDFFRNSGVAALCIEVSRTTRQRAVLVSATMTIVAGSAPTADQLAGYARVLVYAGTINADLTDRTNIQASRSEWALLGVDKILLNHVFPINNGFSLVLPVDESAAYYSQSSQSLGALLVTPCDRLSTVMDGVGSLTFFGASIEDNTDAPKFKVV